MRSRLIWALSSIVAMAFPFAARADLSGTVTLTQGDRFSLDTGITSSTNPGTDLRFSGTSLIPQSNIGIFNYKTSGAAGTTNCRHTSKFTRDCFSSHVDAPAVSGCKGGAPWL